MSFSSIGTYACRALQQNLVDYFGPNTPEMRTNGSKSLIRWLLSPMNTRGFRQIADGITAGQTVPGKKRAIAFALDNPYCFDVCSLSVNCTTERTAIENPTKEVVFDFDGPAFWVCDSEGNPLRLEFERADLAKYCTETDTMYITRHIAAFNKRFVEALNTRIGEQLATMVGTNNDGQAITSIPFFVEHSSGLQTLNPNAFWYLNKLYRDMAGVGQYALIGGDALTKVAMYQKLADLSDAGIDLGRLPGIQPYTFYDRDLNTTLGVNNFFMLSPGAVQLPYFVENIGENNREVTDLYTHSTFIDQDTGLEVDYEWYFEPKCKVWTYEPHSYVQLAVARPGGCKVNDGVNGVLLVEDCTAGGTPPVCPGS